VVDGTFAPHAMPLGGGYEGFNIDLADEIASVEEEVANRRDPVSPASCRADGAPTTTWRPHHRDQRARDENMLFTEGYLNTDFSFW